MTASTAPRWKTAISNAIAKYEKSVVIQLVSIDSTIPAPFVRSLIFRDFLWPTSNPSLPLLIATTDIRTPKVSQIISNPRVEVAWWIEGTQEQFRISGIASIIPTPTNQLYKNFLYSIKSAAKGSAFAGLEMENFDWEKKRRQTFNDMSAHMKTSWCRPTPGSRLEGGHEEANNWPAKMEEPKEGDEDARRNWEIALGNFALLVVDPIEVDFLELGAVPNRRTRFWRTNHGLWDSEALVP